MQSRTTTIRSAFRKIRTDRLCAELYHAQNGLCLICWHPLNEDWLQVDHAISVYMRAESSLSIEDAVQANLRQNLIAVHPACNSIKGGLDYEEFMAHLESGDLTIGAPELMTPERVKQLKDEMSERGRKIGLQNAKNKIGLCGRPKEKMSEDGRKGGLIGGRTNANTGHIRTLGRTHGRIYGPIQGRIQGRKNVDNGHLAEMCRAAKEKGVGVYAPGARERAGKAGGRANLTSGHIQALGQKNVESGWIQALGRITGRNHVLNKTGILGRSKEQMAEDGRKGAPIGHHRRWHASRNIVSPSCSLCKNSEGLPQVA
jgi:hypothetical protein